MKAFKRLAVAFSMGCAFLSGAHATIVSGYVSYTSSAQPSTFIKLTVPFTESSPDNTVGSDNFQSQNLYGFDEKQNYTVTDKSLQLDYVLNGASKVVPIGTVVASHYIFFDPLNIQRIKGYIEFDAPIYGIVAATSTLYATDFLAQPGVSYMNPSNRGLEAGDDSVTVLNPYSVYINFSASSPGDYIRVLTAESPAALPTPPSTVPEPSSAGLVGVGLGLLGRLGRGRRGLRPAKRRQDG